jgi:hypothetical protein
VIRSSKSFETVTVTADMEAILAEATTDHMIRRLITRFSLPECIVRINVLKPVLTIIASEENIGEKLKGGTLRESFRKKAMEAGYIIDDDRSKADYIIRITASAMPGGETGVYRNAVLKGSFSAELPEGIMVFRREFEGFRGSHFDYKRAGEEAFRQAVRRMESSFFREIDEALRRSSQQQR